MITTRKYIVVISAVFFVGALSPVVLAQKGEVEATRFHVSGVWVGTAYSSTVRKLGRPLKHKVKRYTGSNSCLAEDFTLHSLKYSGLGLLFITEGAKGKPVLLGIEITSSKWPVSGVRIGYTQESVKKILGEPNEVRQKGGENLYYYDNRPGDDVEFAFKDGRLIRISQSELIC